MTKIIKIKRFDKSLPLPEYKTKGAAGFDLFTRETVKIKPGQFAIIPVNIAVQTPPDHFLIIAARSSTHKLGVLPINGIGIGDSDFRGDGDEYRFPAFNFTNKTVTIEKGTRIGQGVFVKFTRAKWKEVPKLNGKTRGGFGGTGFK